MAPGFRFLSCEACVKGRPTPRPIALPFTLWPSLPGKASWGDVHRPAGGEQEGLL